MRVNLTELKFEDPTGFIVIEGVNGAGKGTLLNQLKNYLSEKKIDSLFTREPGGSSFGIELRKMFMNGSLDLDPMTETMLFLADRNEHVTKTIKPNLAQGNLVISDRYYYSTLAFQGYGRLLDFDTLLTLNKIAIREYLPDLVILLDLDPEIGLARTTARASKEKDAFETEEIEFHKRLRFGFLDIASKLPEKFIIIDADQDPEQVWQACLPAIDLWLQSVKK